MSVKEIKEKQGKEQPVIRNMDIIERQRSDIERFGKTAIDKLKKDLNITGGGSRKKRSRKARKSIRKKWKLIKHKSRKKKRGRRKYTKRK